MHIRKYDFDYSRRNFLEKTAKGVGTAGVLAPLWPMIAKADTPDISKAYPDELISIEMQTKGKVKPGDIVDANNVEHVAHLLDPIVYKEVSDQGRRIRIKPTETAIEKFFEKPFLEATLSNYGNGGFDGNGNIIHQDGKNWPGGMPFPDAKNGVEAIANLTLAWGRHNYNQYAIRDWDIDSSGKESYQYDFVWSELQVSSRPDGKVFRDETDKLRYQSVWFTAPNEQQGTSFLSTWYYDQRKFPDLIGYIPAFKRVREYPSSQRFEPLVPGFTGFLSDAWAAGDPMLTWGKYKVTERKPMLGAVQDNWYGGRHENWERPVHGGPKGVTFFDTTMELIPETIVFDSEPVLYPRAPVGKKTIWSDVRNGAFTSAVTYDRKGDLWKSFEPGFSKYQDGDTVLKNPENGDTVWTWCYVHIHDVQTNRMSRIVQAREVAGGYQSKYSPEGEDVYNKYLTSQAMRRLGA